MNPLVTIVTPVYNGQEFINRLLDSIVMQDYPNIQFIIVDDGSTDNTKKIIENYTAKFFEKNIDFQYIYQNNQGQSFAVKNALQYVKGHYLTWIDSDDFYYQEKSISNLLAPLLDSLYMVSRGLPIYFNGNNFYNKEFKKSTKEDLFSDCLFVSNDFWFGGYMIDFNYYKLLNCHLSFYCEKDTGQNWQLLLPILFENKCFTIDQSLYCIYEREDSHSRGAYKKPHEIEKKYNAYINTLIQTLKIINIDSQLYDQYVVNIKRQYYRRIFNEVALIDRFRAKIILKKYNVFLNNMLKLYLKTTFFYWIYRKLMNKVGGDNV